MKLTKNILLIVLVLGLTVPKGFWHFAIHIPAFVEHFHHHNEEHGHISVLDFIAEHTTDNDHHRKGHHDHNNLPLHHNHSSDSNQTLTFFSFPHRENTFLMCFLSSSSKIITRQFFHSSEFLQTIWQPPKMS